MGPIGFQELVLILVVALIIFGPKKLPELGRSLGKTLAEFRRASNEIKHNIEKELEDTEEHKQ
jgi:sec-independent protein translocase protein TatA